MTSFGRVFGETFRPKLKTLGKAAIINLMIIAAVIFINIFNTTDPLRANDLMMISIVITFIMTFFVPLKLLVDQERLWNKNSFRLIPTSTTKLIFANISSTLFANIILLIIQIILGIEFYFTFRPTKFFRFEDENGIERAMKFGDLHLHLDDILLVVGVLLVGIIFSTAMVMTVNLLTKTIARQFTGMNNKFAQAGIFFVMFIIVSEVIDRISDLFVGQSELLAMNLTLISVPILSIVLTGISIWLMNNFVETRK